MIRTHVTELADRLDEVIDSQQKLLAMVKRQRPEIVAGRHVVVDAIAGEIETEVRRLSSSERARGTAAEALADALGIAATRWSALREALDLVEKSLEGLGQTRRVGDAVLLVVRPQEAVAAVQALGQANADFYAAVGDYNRAQFRLYRALGHPAQCLAGAVPPAPDPPPAAQPGPLPDVLRVPEAESDLVPSVEPRP